VASSDPLFIPREIRTNKGGNTSIAQIRNGHRTGTGKIQSTIWEFVEVIKGSDPFFREKRPCRLLGSARIYFPSNIVGRLKRYLKL